ncbi:MAG: hypothetical protein AB2L24_19550 [Mangrovibacterium sp.]
MFKSLNLQGDKNDDIEPAGSAERVKCLIIGSRDQPDILLPSMLPEQICTLS